MNPQNSPPSSAPSHPHHALNPRLLLGVLAALMGFASISTDFYLPAMPSMARALDADPGMLEYSISGFLLGFALGQLFWGPLSDRYGRRGPVAVGLLLFCLGSAGCALAPSAEAIIGWRLLQALGASAAVVISRAMVRDLYDGARAAQMLSTLMVVMAIAPLLGPLIGAQVADLAGWRSIFWLLVGLALLSLLGLARIDETLPPARRTHMPLGRAFAGYGRLLRQPRLMAYAGAGGFYYAGMFAYVGGAPFAYIDHHQLPASQFGLLFGAGILGIMSTNLLNARLLQRIASDRLLRLGGWLAACSGAAVAFCGYSDAGGLWGLFAALFAFVSCTGLIVANAIAGALGEHPEQAGAVSALVGALQYGSGILGAGLVGLFADGSAWPMGAVIGASTLGCLLCCLCLRLSPR